MNFRQINKYHLRSEDGGFIINRAGMGGGRLAYMAVRVTDRVGGDILHVERDVPEGDEAARRDAVRRCREACEAAERG